MATVQDDQREEFLRQLFGLVKQASEGRGGTDAVLTLSDGRSVQFELKSATRTGVTTVRDFGPAHILKWKEKHWLIGFFDADGKHLTSCLHASPKQMKGWILEKEEYIRLDFELAELALKVDRSLFEEILVRNFGDKKTYAYEDAFLIQKRQYTKAEYVARMDRERGYSKSRMLDFLAERWVYLTERGSTLNNPHIPASYFSGWDMLPVPRLELTLPVDDEVAKAVQEARARLVRDVTQALDEGEVRPTTG